MVARGREASGGPGTEAAQSVLPAAAAARDDGGNAHQVEASAFEAVAQFPPAPAPAPQAAPDVACRASAGETLDEIAHLR